ncbi:unnamed protein product [Acanthoscelides obtectus]|uniref:Uncharacterized protein n=1 Tax=Acanthoscelides obtectus TaxID=200917 RepID=A0A9P0P3A5_ACAOB|nr:unnamed protein product [Acanthoscelides obtectus]CAK1667360.1 hypothetical protein AOBTE_LOCUS25799 [Acanthoscelides obtectus]
MFISENKLVSKTIKGGFEYFVDELAADLNRRCENSRRLLLSNGSEIVFSCSRWLKPKRWRGQHFPIYTTLILTRIFCMYIGHAVSTT